MQENIDVYSIYFYTKDNFPIRCFFFKTKEETDSILSSFNDKRIDKSKTKIKKIHSIRNL